ncbi:Glutathione-dependent formaldehyde-activating enzyme [Aspergillus sclerotialis]|uniref:Glutathione-dependent formaldehyde-activating enzyme n=1 Tax=Aspergillus sclerotialis TaxID=2070753 RepID=A0A3A2ZXT9_9EURO|nr:Glutathione-dependent formaldehyde-activating enzyme [Aspergillus sclerotialis]
MASGGCFCGNIRVQYNSQPIMSVLCHCSDCRKLTGGLYTYNFAIKTSDLTITGSPKGVAKTADSGNHIKNFFCPDCGTPLYGHKIQSSGDPDEMTILRAGILDDTEILNRSKPQAEIYNNGRIEWLSPVDGAEQFAGMLPRP